MATEHTGIRIRKLILTPTGNFKPVYRRNHKVSLDHRDLNKVATIVGDNYSMTKSRITANDVSAKLNTVISTGDPTLDSQDVKIASGWRNPRLRFMLEVDSIVFGNVFTSFIQGYTDFYDPRQKNGLADPRTILRINSIINILKYDLGNGRYRPDFHSSFNVIGSDDDGSSHYMGGRNQEVLRANTPLDLMRSTMNQGLASNANDGVTVRDSSNIINGESLTSKKTNNSSGYFGAEAVSGYIAALATASPTDDETDIMYQAVSNVSELTLDQIPFIQTMSATRGELLPTKFTFADILMLDPNIMHDKRMVMSNSVSDSGDNNFDGRQPIMGVSNGGGIDLHTAELENNIAFALIEGVTAVISSNSLTVANFTISNVGGLIDVVPLNGKSIIEGLSVESFLEKSKLEIISDVLPGVLQNNLIKITAHVECDIYGRSVCGISVNGGQMVPVIYPAMSDSLYAPIVSDSQTSEELATGFRDMIGTVHNTVLNVKRQIAIQNNPVR